MRRRVLAALPLALALAGSAAPAAGQEPYPSRPITIVVPFPPGGIADLTARPLAAALERLVKQPVVIANKAGAAGAVGNQSVAIARPDGYTLLLGLVSISTLPEVDVLFGRTPVYSREQFVGIARLNADPPVLVANADQPWKTLPDLLEDARKRPGEITFASSGPYGASHVPIEMMLQAAGGLKMRHLPTTGGGPATTAVLGGHAHLWASPPSLAIPHIKAGKMRPLAVWGASRLASLPDVPAVKELGYDLEYYLWTGLFAPRNIPPPVVQALRDAVRKAVQDPEFKAAMDKAQLPIAYLDSDEFKAWWDADAERLARVIKQIGRVETR
jgi:tripartite-type tricarboxylate transporter receptor subunit TctC